jgi:ABC-type branched-subunit amino acid transport system substrate-binding protein/tRNA A-37 threonylcarbamoyl transferase component Bud32
MEVYCTRPRQPNEKPHNNSIPDHLIQVNSGYEAGKSQLQEYRCETCQMPLALDDARYIPTQEIGHGGFGRAILALDRRLTLSQRVLKQLRHEFVFEWQLRQAQESFQTEAEILYRLRHEHIPRIDMPFTMLSNPDPRIESQSTEPQRFFYLAQEYVDGSDLQRSLKQKGQPFQEREVETLLKDLLNILDYIHSRGVIHRDVKPSNIIRASDGSYHLIDFGSVKLLQLVQGLDASSQTTAPIYTKGFSAPEVENGKAYFQSDLYSLAATCVNLLTNQNPKNFDIPDQLGTWHKQAQVSPKLVNILNRMLQQDYRKRHKTAAEVLQALSPPRFPTWQKLLFAVGGLGGLGLVGLLVGQTGHVITGPIPAIELPQYFSRGEEILVDNGSNAPVTSLCQQAFIEKKKGVDAFALADYKTAFNHLNQAIEQFKQARQSGNVPTIDQSDPNSDKKTQTTCATDPETLVFLNNAKAIRRGNPLTIAVSLPLGDDPAWRGAAIEMLTGVAQVQQEFNDTANSRLLQVVITEDNNNQAESRQIAELLANNQIPGDSSSGSNTEILGVVGHLTSAATQSAASVYQPRKLVLISPSSTAVRSPQFPLSSMVFRTATTDAISGQDLANYAKAKAYKAALVVHNHDDSYSQSLKQVFTNTTGQHDPALECDLVTKTAQDCLKQANAKGVDMLFLAIGTTYIDKTKDIININQQRLPILAGDAQYSGELLGSVGQAAEGMVVAVPWHRDLANPMFKQKLIDQWGTSSVSWRVGTSYDAAIALVEAIRQAGATPTRQAVYDALKQPNFSTIGATGTVKFEAAGDRQIFTGLGVLVQVKQEGGLRTFIRLETPER